MRSAWIWAGCLAIGVATVYAAAAVGTPSQHIAVTAVVCLAFAVLAVLERGRLTAAGAGEAALASSTANAMGLVWAWAALSLLLTYVLLLSWIEWWQYVLGAGAIATLCLGFAAIMSRDASAGRQDAPMLALARYLTIGQLVGMAAAMIGLVFDDKMPRDPHKPDWAASTIFFFGAAALAIISLNALRGMPPQRS